MAIGRFKPLIDDSNNTYVYDPETETASKVIELEEVVVQGKPKTENLEMPWSSLSNTLIGGGFGGYVSTLSIQDEKAPCWREQK